MENDPAFLSTEVTARRIGVPVEWLRREVAAGRIPALRIGRQILLNPAAVQTELLSRATTELSAVDHKPGDANA